MFLPLGHDFELVEDFSATHCIRVTVDDVITTRAAFGLMHTPTK